MANREKSFRQNVRGKYYVDDQCIDCDMCSETAPENFARSEKGHAYVCKQPENEEEETLCENAQSSCPVEAIGSDE